MARLVWNVPCTATRTRDGQPCAAWSMRGSLTCRCHGSATKAARELAAYRLWRLRSDQRLVQRIAAIGERERRMSPAERAAAGQAALEQIAAALPPPKPRERHHPPLYDPETGISWSLTR